MKPNNEKHIVELTMAVIKKTPLFLKLIYLFSLLIFFIWAAHFVFLVIFILYLSLVVSQVKELFLFLF